VCWATLTGEPAAARIDRSINFNWRSGLITPTKTSDVSVRWEGYLKSPESEVFTDSSWGLKAEPT
jgi:hypothetical protein